jgi:Domain of unknown function (DUF1996).
MRRYISTFLGAVTTALVYCAIAMGAPAAIFTGDFTGQQAFNDPIVSPGVRSAHEHCFYGVAPVNQTETEATLKDADHTSFWDVGDNHTAVWIPCVYENGVLLQPYVGGQDRDILAYYQPISGTECLPPENGAQGVTHEVTWRGQLNSGTITTAPPTNSVDGSLVLIAFFRGGRDLGVSCFPTVKTYIRFQVGAGPIGHLTFGGPVAGVDGASDDPAFVHLDYKYGHQDSFFRSFLDQCVIPGRACGTNPTF